MGHACLEASKSLARCSCLVLDLSRLPSQEIDRLTSARAMRRGPRTSRQGQDRGPRQVQQTRPHSRSACTHRQIHFCSAYRCRDHCRTKTSVHCRSCAATRGFRAWSSNRQQALGGPSRRLEGWGYHGAAACAELSSCHHQRTPWTALVTTGGE